MLRRPLALALVACASAHAVRNVGITLNNGGFKSGVDYTAVWTMNETSGFDNVVVSSGRPVHECNELSTGINGYCGGHPTIALLPGDIVTWTGHPGQGHYFKIEANPLSSGGAGQFEEGQKINQTGESFNFTWTMPDDARKTGTTYSYVCPLHNVVMRGTIQLAPAPVEKTKCDGCTAHTATTNAADCWATCGFKAGYCDKCNSITGNTRGACCRKETATDPLECRLPQVNFIVAGDYHECVLVPNKTTTTPETTPTSTETSTPTATMNDRRHMDDFFFLNTGSCQNRHGQTPTTSFGIPTKGNTVKHCGQICVDAGTDCTGFEFAPDKCAVFGNTLVNGRELNGFNLNTTLEAPQVIDDTLVQTFTGDVKHRCYPRAGPVSAGAVTIDYVGRNYCVDANHKRFPEIESNNLGPEYFAICITTCAAMDNCDAFNTMNAGGHGKFCSLLGENITASDETAAVNASKGKLGWTFLKASSLTAAVQFDGKGKVVSVDYDLPFNEYGHGGTYDERNCWGGKTIQPLPTSTAQVATLPERCKPNNCNSCSPNNQDACYTTKITQEFKKLMFAATNEPCPPDNEGGCETRTQTVRVIEEAFRVFNATGRQGATTASEIVLSHTKHKPSNKVPTMFIYIDKYWKITCFNNPQMTACGADVLQNGSWNVTLYEDDVVQWLGDFNGTNVTFTIRPHPPHNGDDDDEIYDCQSTTNKCNTWHYTSDNASMPVGQYEVFASNMGYTGYVTVRSGPRPHNAPASDDSHAGLYAVIGAGGLLALFAVAFAVRPQLFGRSQEYAKLWPEDRPYAGVGGRNNLL